MNDIISAVGTFIGTVGFPAAVSVFLLYRMSKSDDRNAEQQENLRKTIENNTESIRELSEIVRGFKNV